MINSVSVYLSISRVLHIWRIVCPSLTDSFPCSMYNVLSTAFLSIDDVIGYLFLCCFQEYFSRLICLNMGFWVYPIWGLQIFSDMCINICHKVWVVLAMTYTLFLLFFPCFFVLILLLSISWYAWWCLHKSLRLALLFSSTI